jgi:hypothetical protein
LRLASARFFDAPSNSHAPASTTSAMAATNAARRGALNFSGNLRGMPFKLLRAETRPILHERPRARHAPGPGEVTRALSRVRQEFVA